MTISPGVAPKQPSGITVLIVGLGTAGLTAAIECHRQGHRVIAFERAKEIKSQIGDGIGIASNAAKVVSHWGNGAVREALCRVSCSANVVEVHDNSGTPLIVSRLDGYIDGEGYMVPRGPMMSIFYEHARSLGIPLHLGCVVEEYWETDTEAGVILASGERFVGDCVLCTDGVHGRGRDMILGEHSQKSRDTGYSSFRTLFSTEVVAADPASRWVLEGTDIRDRSLMFLGRDMEFMMATFENGKNLMWFCTHRDTSGGPESWTRSCSLEHAIGFISSWPCRDKLEPIIRKTPGATVLDHRLVVRSPLSTWRSAGGRMMVLGDAAHPINYTVGQGVGQAVEDGAVVAIALRLAGASAVPLALHVTEMIRHPRATILQEAGAKFQAVWRNANWDDVCKDLNVLRMPRPKWIFDHDCQSYVLNEFDNVVRLIQTGAGYVPSNLPPDGTTGMEDDYNS
ncbi:FAD/NAD(P)-binding domain-containing protein [Penicillium soppii]|uniref:FAD/NAD(P)-binding domain-containing protein n=1 Tax=Penicillium soppii TaxID=69789 RepID=UPI002546DD1A|nr:FAD/NAD(P)-binding domain-containing protein [Penicillium soppii]KAJ5871118.1 FAD/NAD(P)-binding domain-containing protein [Penicillium soppii]